jgi:hypothetical protein
VQILKWALVASAQETSSLLIDKGKRDAESWVAAMELEPLVQQKLQQQQQQQPGADSQHQDSQQVFVGLSSSGQTQVVGQQPSEASPEADPAGSLMAGGGDVGGGTAPVDQEAAAAWTDHKQDSQRQAEARHAQDLTSQAEKAAAKECGRDVEGRVQLSDVAVAAGVEDQVLDHAEDAADLAGHAAKRRKV